MVSGIDPRLPRSSIDGLTKPDPREFASQILAWAICWPWNLVWTVCVNNPFRYLIEFLFLEIRSAFEEISSGQFEAIEKDLLLDDERVAEPVTLQAETSRSLPGALAPAQWRTMSEPAACADESVGTAPREFVETATVAAPARSGERIGDKAEFVRQTPALPTGTPIWTPPEARPFAPEPSRTLPEPTQPSGGVPERSSTATPPYLPTVSAQNQPVVCATSEAVRRPAPEIDEAGGSVATERDPWYSTWKPVPNGRPSNGEPRK